MLLTSMNFTIVIIFFVCQVTLSLKTIHGQWKFNARNRPLQRNSYSTSGMLLQPIFNYPKNINFPLEREQQSTMTVKQSSVDVDVVDVKLTDIFQILDMCNTQFLQKDSSNFTQWFELDSRILTIFLPKFLFPDTMGHKLIGLKSKSSSKLIGFVDISLQTNDGSLGS